MRKKIVRKIRKTITPNFCPFCKEEKSVNFTEIDTMRKYVTDRGKIVSRLRSGVCAKHQRKLSLAIKYARHLALLSYSGQH